MSAFVFYEVENAMPRCHRCRKNRHNLRPANIDLSAGFMEGNSFTRSQLRFGFKLLLWFLLEEQNHKKDRRHLARGKACLVFVFVASGDNKVLLKTRKLQVLRCVRAGGF